MKPLEEIVQRMQKYPDVKCEVLDASVTIFPVSESGFHVGFTQQDSSYTVNFDGWHEEYNDAEKALNVFAFGLSDACRLRVDFRGSVAYKWEVEEIDEEGNWASCAWVGMNITGLIFFPFWLKQRTVYLQNNLVKE